MTPQEPSADRAALADSIRLHVLTRLVEIAHDDIPETRMNNAVRVSLNEAHSYARGGYSSGLTRDLEAEARAALASMTPAETSLDEAWKAAEAALPKGYQIKNLSARFYPVSRLPSHWVVEYQDEHGWFRGGVEGHTPTLALLALRDALTTEAGDGA